MEFNDRLKMALRKMQYRFKKWCGSFVNSNKNNKIINFITRIQKKINLQYHLRMNISQFIVTTDVKKWIKPEYKQMHTSENALCKTKWPCRSNASIIWYLNKFSQRIDIAMNQYLHRFHMKIYCISFQTFLFHKRSYHL